MSTIKKTHELKALQVEHRRAESELKILTEAMKAASRQHAKQQAVVSDMEYKIKQFSKLELVVSEHAILRYLERADIINVDAVREAILTDDVKASYKQFGNGKYPLDFDGIRAIVKSGVIVSVA